MFGLAARRCQNTLVAMMDLAEAKRILAALWREGVDYVLVGSMAMAAQGLVRATRDLDFFVAPTSPNVERLKKALKSLYADDASIDQISVDDLAGQYPAIRYAPPQGDYYIDILSHLGEAFRYEEIEREEVTLDGVRVQVATPRMLFRMKRDTVRPQDRLDAEALRQAFGLEEK
jgi:hypothetical protein